MEVVKKARNNHVDVQTALHAVRELKKASARSKELMILAGEELKTHWSDEKREMKRLLQDCQGEWDGQENLVKLMDEINNSVNNVDDRLGKYRTESDISREEYEKDFDYSIEILEKNMKIKRNRIFPGCKDMGGGKGEN